MTNDVARGHLRCSVALCTYNGARFLEAQLESLRSQTLAPFEVVVCDDGSTDETWGVLTAFAASTGLEVRLHRNPTTLGSTRNFEQAVGLCRGDLIFLCDQDDVWRADKLDVVEAVFARRPAVGLVFSDAELVDAARRPLGHSAWETEQVGLSAEHQELFRRGGAFERMFNWNAVTGATMAFRADLRELVLPFPDLLDRRDPVFHLHDGWMALLISAVAEVEPLADRLVEYRLHDAQQIGLEVERPATRSARKEGRAAEITRRERELAVVVARLYEVADRWPAREDLLRRLHDELDHIRVRLTLPRSPTARLHRILREVRSGRYTRYSTGRLSALVDVLPPLRDYLWRTR